MIAKPPEARGGELVACLNAYYIDPTFRPARLAVTFDQFCDLRALELINFVSRHSFDADLRPTGAHDDVPYFRGVRVVLQGEK